MGKYNSSNDSGMVSTFSQGSNLSKEQSGGIGGTVRVSIDGIEVRVPFGTTVLEAARRVGVQIPTLCHHEDLCVAGVCRICIVEIEGERNLQASCSYSITSPIKVKTYSARIRKARRHILDLLLSEHYGSCSTCVKNNNCELQSLAKEYGVDFFRFGKSEIPRYRLDRSSYSIVRDMNKCIQCRRCVRACVELQGVGALGIVGRGNELRISSFMEKPLADVVCINCGQCIVHCPTGALHENDSSDDVWRAIDDPTKHVVIQTAPSPRAAIGEEFGCPPGTSVTRQLNTALRRCGFDRVFDTNFTADLTIIEEGTELLLRLKKLLVDGDVSVRFPQFTSCSPGWVKFCEYFYPEFIENLSSAKSPQQMFGAIIKTYYSKLHGINPEDIVTVALMPCTAKKYECNRPEMQDSGFKDVDYAVTTRELAGMIKEMGLNLPTLPKSNFDEPFGEASGAGLIFGATGGVMEAALRTVIELITGKRVEEIFPNMKIEPVRGFEGIKYAEFPITEVGSVPSLLKSHFESWEFLRGITLKVAVVHGTANARVVLDDIKRGGKFSECHFIEFMACPGGCLGGGGQPIPTSPEIRRKRAEAIYAEEETLEYRKSHENPHIVQIYRDFLTEGPCSELSHKLLHTYYMKRGNYIV